MSYEMFGGGALRNNPYIDFIADPKNKALYPEMARRIEAYREAKRTGKLPAAVPVYGPRREVVRRPASPKPAASRPAASKAAASKYQPSYRPGFEPVKKAASPVAARKPAARAAPKYAMLKATDALSDDEAAGFSSYCRGYSDPATCKATTGCKWLGGKVNRCQRSAGAEATAAMMSKTSAAKTLQRAFRSRVSAPHYQQQGGYWW